MESPPDKGDLGGWVFHQRNLTRFLAQSLYRIYTAIILSAMAPIFLSAFIVFSHLVIKSFDLVIALTGGGPGYATDLPATLYVCHGVFTRRPWSGGSVGYGNDGGRFRNRRSLSLFRAEATMTQAALCPTTGMTKGSAVRMVSRFCLFAVLITFAAIYLMPLFVMLTTSLKSLDEIRSGSLLALPRAITFEAWSTAWSGACSGGEM